MPRSPLDNPRIREIDQMLDRNELDRARVALGEIGYLESFRDATSYLVTRMLFQKGALDAGGVAERLRDLLRPGTLFPQAAAMLAASERGELRPEWRYDPATEEERARIGLGDTAFAAQPKSGATLPIPPSVEDTPSEEAVAPTRTLVIDRPAPRTEPLVAARTVPIVADAAESDEGSAPSHRHASRTEPIFEDPASPEREPPRPEPLLPEPVEVALSLDPPLDVLETDPPERPPPTPFEVTMLLGEGRFDSALELLDAALDPSDPQLAGLRARALIGAGRPDEAAPLLLALARTPLLEPRLRVDSARQLIEIGEVDEAYDQARRALEDDDAAEPVRVVVAWAGLRRARVAGEAEHTRLVEEAHRLLADIEPRGRQAALIFALQACTAVGREQWAEAVSEARRALDLDRDCADGWYALAVAEAKLGNPPKSARAWGRLSVVAPTTAHALAPKLEALGVDLADAAASVFPPPGSIPPPAVEHPVPGLGDPVELALGRGDDASALREIEAAFAARWSALADNQRADEPTVVATVTANLLVSAPVFSHFAPFDLSLPSLARLDAALLVLLGTEPRAGVASDLPVLSLMLAAYVGETVRQAHEGTWRGAFDRPDEAMVVAGTEAWAPHRLVLDRVEKGPELGLVDAAGASVVIEDDEAWRHSIPIPSSPPAPWGGSGWPSPNEMQRLGTHFDRSVVGLYCEKSGAGRLDGGRRSLQALESYVALLPSGARRDDSGWRRRVAVMCGAYLGEVLRRAGGGAWAAGEASGPGSVRVVLESGVEASPVSYWMERLVREHSDSTVPDGTDARDFVPDSPPDAYEYAEALLRVAR